MSWSQYIHEKKIPVPPLTVSLLLRNYWIGLNNVLLNKILFSVLYTLKSYNNTTEVNEKMAMMLEASERLPCIITVLHFWKLRIDLLVHQRIYFSANISAKWCQLYPVFSVIFQTNVCKVLQLSITKNALLTLSESAYIFLLGLVFQAGAG